MKATRNHSLAALKIAIQTAAKSMNDAIDSSDMTIVWIRAETIKTLGSFYEFIDGGASAIEAWKYFCGLETGLRDDVPAAVQAWCVAAYAKDEGVDPASLYTEHGFKAVKAFL